MSRFLARRWRTILALAIGVAVGGYGALGLLIGHQVRGEVERAQATVGGEPIAALLTVADSDDASLSQRNHAIWALGQLGAAEALPLLRRLRTGQPCVHDSLVCQREVEKAIALCDGAPNLGAMLWRHGELAAR